MIIPGLCSITFRKRSSTEIIRLAVKAKLQAIEWGGDIHVPHGDEKIAAQVRDATLEAGLAVSSYGSYYRAAAEEVNFGDVLRSADVLGVKVIRVWAGTKGSAESSPEHFAAVAKDLRNCADKAREKNISIALEFHGNTLTDSNETAVQLLDAVPEISIIWQPSTNYDVSLRLEGLRQLLPRLANLHVFQWDANGRLPLSDGKSEWPLYFAEAARVSGDRYAFLEFTLNDDPKSFLEDAGSLRRMLENPDCLEQSRRL